NEASFPTAYTQANPSSSAPVKAKTPNISAVYLHQLAPSHIPTHSCITSNALDNPEFLEVPDNPSPSSVSSATPESSESSESPDNLTPSSDTQSIPSNPVSTPHIPSSSHPSHLSHTTSLSPSSHRLTINLYASNNISQMNDHNPVTMSGKMAQVYSTAVASLNGKSEKRFSPIYLANYTESKKHYLPLSLGLTATYPFTDKVSISTGMVYTRLRSDFTYSMNENRIEKEQLLQYLGIPLSIQYQWWKHKNFQAYISFGGQVDWNIKAKVTTESTSTTIDKDHCQWSLNGSLGVQYGIIPQLSLYAEPGIKHYFNNGSKIDNIFKDKPNQFNIEMGLRLHIPK
ncbi:MAG: outer membrane beta-barrel protein, partial [Prevotella sp.]|nr:outer membrane beta-barrel protein [Prevotella sp.]